MLPLLAELTTDARTVDERGSVRRTLRLEVHAHSSLDITNALVRNLSERGLLIETAADLAVGETIQVDLPEAGASAARIMWAKRPFFGCEFTKPVSKATVSAALLLAPIEPSQVHTLPDLPTYPIFGNAHTSPDHDIYPDATTPGINVTLMASLTLALLMVAIFIYALLKFQFST